jgi:hypothetical protein
MRRIRFINSSVREVNSLLNILAETDARLASRRVPAAGQVQIRQPDLDGASLFWTV